MMETVSNCPSIGDDFLPPGVAILQNLPSIICVHVLDPRPQDAVLDMCASPGNKTTHIATFLQNQVHTSFKIHTKS
jgi:16S rRNA C967 or C1407 C5-methylase (RsmB/RsmF family)